MFKKYAAITGAVVAVVLVAFSLQSLAVEWWGYFAGEREEVRREVFEESQSFQKSAVRDLREYRRKILDRRAKLSGLPEDSERREIMERHVDALESAARSRAAEFESDDLEEHPQIRDFVDDLRR